MQFVRTMADGGLAELAINSIIRSIISSAIFGVRGELNGLLIGWFGGGSKLSG